MPDLSKYYSYKGEIPIQLPWEISWFDGSMQVFKTDNGTFTDSEIKAAGWTGPYDKPEIKDQYTQKIVWDPEELTWECVYISDEEFYEKLRVERNFRLLECDWTDLPNTPLSPEKKSEWMSYRQELRNLPGNVSQLPKPKDTKTWGWPTKPE